MPRFAANLSMLYGEHAFCARFAAAAADGFEGVECLFPYEHEAATLRQLLDAHGLQQVLFNAPPGDWPAGERGLACLPGRQAEFREALHLALAYAHRLGCAQVHVMAGLVPAGVDRASLQGLYVDNLAWAAEQAGPAGVRLLIEPINGRDMPGYFLHRQDHAHEIVSLVDSPHLGIQMDLYHCQVVEGDVETKLRRYLPGGRVHHLQIAGVPRRHEPDEGELNAQHLFDVIDELSAAHGWRGWIGCEYRPRDTTPGGTSRGLRWRR